MTPTTTAKPVVVGAEHEDVLAALDVEADEEDDGDE